MLDRIGFETIQEKQLSCWSSNLLTRPVQLGISGLRLSGLDVFGLGLHELALSELRLFRLGVSWFGLTGLAPLVTRSPPRSRDNSSRRRNS